MELLFQRGKRGRINNLFGLLVGWMAVCSLKFAAIVFVLTPALVRCQVDFLPNPGLHKPCSVVILSVAGELSDILLHFESKCLHLL